mmetsp:Transcript_10124/g.21491  ORF Transcript_10124/g.21491 Transcript_10124/m.21491 type:complete len:371 (-) Transcript_10124:307-1419(-)
MRRDNSRRHVRGRRRSPRRRRLDPFQRRIGMKRPGGRFRFARQLRHGLRPHGPPSRRRQEGIVAPDVISGQGPFQVASVTGLDPGEGGLQSRQGEAGPGLGPGIAPETRVEDLSRRRVHHLGRIAEQFHFRRRRLVPIFVVDDDAVEQGGSSDGAEETKEIPEIALVSRRFVLRVGGAVDSREGDLGYVSEEFQFCVFSLKWLLWELRLMWLLRSFHSLVVVAVVHLHDFIGNLLRRHVPRTIVGDDLHLGNPLESTKVRPQRILVGFVRIVLLSFYLRSSIVRQSLLLLHATLPSPLSHRFAVVLAADVTPISRERGVHPPSVEIAIRRGGRIRILVVRGGRTSDGRARGNERGAARRFAMMPAWIEIR